MDRDLTDQVISAVAKYNQQDTKVEPDLTAISALRPADLICHLWQRYAATALIPLVASSVSLRREMVTTNQHSVVRMEGKITEVVQKAIDGECRVFCWTS